MGAKLGLPHMGRKEVESALSRRVTANQKTFLNQELHDVYCSQNIILATKTKRKTLVGHVAFRVEKCTQDCDGKPGRKDTNWKNQAWMG